MMIALTDVTGETFWIEEDCIESVKMKQENGWTIITTTSGRVYYALETVNKVADIISISRIGRKR